MQCCNDGVSGVQCCNDGVSGVHFQDCSGGQDVSAVLPRTLSGGRHSGLSG